jgi:F0F1-type ATP synthase membrane subunit c/vacuolar-type H+-ATPase subunit K
MGLFANIPAIEAAESLIVARAVAMALGDGKSLAGAVYAVTENPRLATRIEVQAQLAQGMNQ